MSDNLNDMYPDDQSDELHKPFLRNSVSSKSVTCYFRDIENVLVTKINEAPIVLAATAWLTSESIIKALANVSYSSCVVVQKEDFLRPDYQITKGWKKKLHDNYAQIRGLQKEDLDGLIPALSVIGDPHVHGVRCVGNYNHDKKATSPRMHNKFFIFCDYDFWLDESGNSFGVIDIKPYAIWTGSYNPTKNATNSLENGVYIVDDKIANRYYEEFCQILAISEPLDWESEWCTPQWRIGT